MNVSIREEGGKHIAKVEGRVDTTNAKDFENAIAILMTCDNPDIELDCEELSYISSSGLRVFLMLQKSVMSRGGKLTITHINPAILEVFKMTGFSTIFNIE